MIAEVEIHPHEYCDRGFSVVVNGETVAEADYDAHGWGGIENMEKTVRSIAKAVGWTVVDKR